MNSHCEINNGKNYIKFTLVTSSMYNKEEMVRKSKDEFHIYQKI